MTTKALREVLEKALCPNCYGTGQYRISDDEIMRCQCSAIERAFIRHAFSVCAEFDEKAAGHEDSPLHCVVCAAKHRRLALVQDVLFDAGVT